LAAATTCAARFVTVNEAAGALVDTYGMGAPGVTGVVDCWTLLMPVPVPPTQSATAGVVAKTDLTLEAMRSDSDCAAIESGMTTGQQGPTLVLLSRTGGQHTV
jgi:hypothetical protein